MKILQTTINDFPYETIEPRSTLIEPLEFEVKIFPETPNDYDLADSPCMRPFFTKYLASDEAKKLREAYWAYLFQQYLNKIKNMNKEEYAEVMPEIRYRNELVQSQKILPSPSLNRKDLSAFFQQYKRIEFYFVGVLVYNLLWTDKIIDKQPIE